MEWERSTFDADGLTGERLILRGKHGFTHGCIIIWPGRRVRIFWPGGRISDMHGGRQRERAVQLIERQAGI
jgi:hypothetical protein